MVESCAVGLGPIATAAADLVRWLFSTTDNAFGVLLMLRLTHAESLFSRRVSLGLTGDWLALFNVGPALYDASPDRHASCQESGWLTVFKLAFRPMLGT